MNLFGRFLELSLPAPDIRQSLDWYLMLGFAECPVGDSYAHHYAVVTDGRLYIGLHGAGIEEPQLTFVRPELSRHLDALHALGLNVDETYQGDERVHQLLLNNPSGMPARLIEARTFSPVDCSAPPLVGQVRHLKLTAPYPDDAAQFWEQGGFDAHDDDERIELLTPGMTLVLDSGKSAPQLSFYCQNLPALTEQLEKQAIRYQRNGEVLDLVSPEGLKLNICG